MLKYEQVRNEEQLKADGFNTEDLAFFKKLTAHYFYICEEMRLAEEKKNFDKFVELEPEVAELEFAVRYLGKNPRDISKEDLKAHVAAMEHDDTFTQNYLRRVRNPGTAVRAFCIKCMGGSAPEVRACQAMTCPLWPFRLGENPFFGKKLPRVVAVDASSIEDDVQVIEDETEGVTEAE